MLLNFAIFLSVSLPSIRLCLCHTLTAQSRLWLHHIPRPLHRGQGTQGADSHARRQEDRSETCHAQESTTSGQQDQEDICGRRFTGHIGRRSEGLLQSVRRRRGDGHAYGSANETPSRLWFCYLRERGRCGSRM